jgi:alanine dehydrogenase
VLIIMKFTLKKMPEVMLILLTRNMQMPGQKSFTAPEELYTKSEMIVKVAPPTEEERRWMQPNQALISALHLGNMKKNF